MRLPPGLAANIRGTPLCSETALASHDPAPVGDAGHLRDEPPLCPPASRVGSDFIGVGAGPQPYFLDEGPIYLAGPFRGAPFSLVIVVPAKAGPFDLGTVITRAAVFIDPRTAEARIVAEPLPQILRGVPFPTALYTLSSTAPA